MKRTAAILGMGSLAAALAGAGAGALIGARPAIATAMLEVAVPAQVRHADFRGHFATADVQRVADWSVHTADNKELAFIVIDKANARAYAFDRYGTLVDSTAVLLGMGVGDRFEPGVLQMDMYKTKPSQRITPAGRFFAEEDRNLKGEKVLWVDYDAGIAIHKLPSKRTKQRRHERIVSPDPAEHRITYGCVNVPPAFYDRVVAPHFRAKGGIVYVLPDSTPVDSVFQTREIAPREFTRTVAGERPTTLQRF